MTGEARALIDGYLAGESGAVTRVEGWIQSAASPFRRRLGHQWDDLLQDLHLEVLRELQKDRFRGDSSIKTYIWRVVSHSCLDRVRLASRWQWTELEEEIADGSGERPRRGRSVSLETRDLVARVLAQVSEECRNLWKMIWEGASYGEISRVLGVSEGALRVRALRCRQRALAVREGLEPELEGEL